MGKLLILASLLTLYSCNNNNNSTVADPNEGIPIVDPDTSGAISLPAFEARIQARAASGDTALTDHMRLRAALTDSIPGYSSVLNSSDQFSSGAFTFTEAGKEFYNPKEDYIALTLGDYVRNPDFFRVNIRRHNLAQGVEIGGVKDEKRKVDGLRPAAAKEFFTWSSYNARKRMAWVYVGVDERWFLTVEASGQDGFLDLEQVKRWVDWGRLYAPQGM
jgi:hypothetical protein